MSTPEQIIANLLSIIDSSELDGLIHFAYVHGYRFPAETSKRNEAIVREARLYLKEINKKK